jgi:hypothetical protein
MLEEASSSSARGMLQEVLLLQRGATKHRIRVYTTTNRPSNKDGRRAKKTHELTHELDTRMMLNSPKTPR